jgi:hypothetical protein
MAGRFDAFKFRASALGHIMTASGKITDGCATYLQELFIGETYGIKKEVSSMYFEKGNYMEQDGITLLQKTLYPNNLLLKNRKPAENEYIKGECDCKTPDGYVYDIKNAWDVFTFNKATLTHNYKWQVRGYQWLEDRPKGRLFYCLNNMPEHLLQDMERKLFYSGRYATFENPDYIAACEKLRAEHNYDGLELWERFKVFDVPFEDKNIQQIKDMVIKCREYLNKLDEERDDWMHRNISLMGGGIIAERDNELNTTIVKPL